MGGVQVIVDVLLNHMGQCPDEQCTGWAGSKFGHRSMEGANGWDAATPENFHHKPGHPMERMCVVGQATGWLCGSPTMRDCSCCECEMYGMPDWNTSQPAVQDIQR